jgi:hypothetical protein
VPIEDKTISEHLNKEQERTLLALIYLIIPPSEDGRMPGAADTGFIAYMYDRNLVPWIQEGLIVIAGESYQMHENEFSGLNVAEQLQITEKIRRKHPRFFIRLTTEIIQCYYQHETVIKAIGLEARPPFPDGYQVEEGDLTLLGPVYERGKIYRDCVDDRN